MSRFYIATTITRWKEHNLVRDRLIAHGHEITYDWTLNPDGGDLRGKPLDVMAHVAALEMGGIVDADFVVVLLPGGYGTHAEIGAAYITSTPTIIHAFDPAFFSNDPETGKVRNFYLGPYTKRIIHEDLKTTADLIADWWSMVEADRECQTEEPPPAHLAHLAHLETCEDCPVGGRWTLEEGDKKGTCPRAPLCDWEAAHTRY